MNPTPSNPSMSTATEETEYIKRPSNKWLLFRSCRAREIIKEFEEESLTITQQTLSSMLSAEWKTLQNHVRAWWAHQAAEKAREHKLKYPRYKYQPGKKGRKKTKKTSRGKKMPPASPVLLNRTPTTEYLKPFNILWDHYVHPAPVEPLELPIAKSLPEATQALNSTSVSGQSDNVQASRNQYQNQDRFTSAGMADATGPAASQLNWQLAPSGQWVAPGQSLINVDTTNVLEAPTQSEPTAYEYSAPTPAQESISSWKGANIHETFEDFNSNSSDATYVPAVFPSASSGPIYQDIGAKFVPPTTVRPQDLHAVGEYPLFNYGLNIAPQDGYDVTVGELTGNMTSEFQGFDECSSMSHQYASHGAESSQAATYDQGFSSSQPWGDWGDMSSFGYGSYSEAPSS
ncbi:hypothetical protein BDQ17DRAFT_746205 [Cyathus striatus]|nr:hypothetical protein BDQ17DRAFT_746205 [Cyathus striatus]